MSQLNLPVRDNTPTPPRALLRDLWQAGVDSVGGRRCVRQYLDQHPTAAGPHAVIAIGKAAGDMMLGALDQLGDRVHSGLVLTKHHHIPEELAGFSQIDCAESSHPLPDRSSLNAGRQLLRFIATIPQQHNCIVLLSGGASSLVEVLQAPCTLTDLQTLSEWALNSGLDIHEINYMRQCVSRIKGGRLRAYFPQNSIQCLYISDVPGDSVSVIGSGLLQRSETDTERLSAAARQRIDQVLQATVPGLLPLTAPGESEFINDQHFVIASNAVAKRGVQQHAHACGLVANVIEQPLDGDYQQVAERIVSGASVAAPGLTIWGGEPTVTLPENPGKGGRNQALALLLAQYIQGRDDVVILVAGTDGTDGPTDAAGAIIDGRSWGRAIARGWQPQAALQAANAYPCLHAMGDLLVSGPTGTNVMDLVIVLRTASQSEG